MPAADNSVIDRFEELNVWHRSDVRAPHKPLLVMYALARFSRGEFSPLRFEDLVTDLTALLREFGPSRKSYHPEYPFWRLQNDRLWVVESDAPMSARSSNTDAKKSELIAKHATGRFSDDVAEELRTNPLLITRIARRLLEEHFAESLHDDILSAVGLSLAQAVSRSRRDPRFREKILVAYERRCAVCHLDLRLGSTTVAIEAAHIKWHQAGGPDVEPNGLALCSVHHKIFDLGAMTIDAQSRILVSEHATGSDGFESVLLRYHGQPARAPLRSEHRPGSKFLAWHRREVFKEEARDA
jgi:putative restriction endonuclease